MRGLAGPSRKLAEAAGATPQGGTGLPRSSARSANRGRVAHPRAVSAGRPHRPLFARAREAFRTSPCRQTHRASESLSNRSRPDQPVPRAARLRIAKSPGSDVGCCSWSGVSEIAGWDVPPARGSPWRRPPDHSHSRARSAIVAGCPSRGSCRSPGGPRHLVRDGLAS